MSQPAPRNGLESRFVSQTAQVYKTPAAPGGLKKPYSNTITGPKGNTDNKLIAVTGVSGLRVIKANQQQKKIGKR
jgi:hypothetical protein